MTTLTKFYGAAEGPLGFPLTDKHPSRRYILHPFPEGVCQVQWCGTSPLKADELVA